LKVKEPDTDTYDKFTLAMEIKSVEHLEAWADVILFAKEEVYTQKDKSQRVRASAGDRMIFTRDCPRYLGENRYGLRQEVKFDWNAFSTEFAKATTEQKEGA